MPWKVKAFMHFGGGMVRFKKVAEQEEFDDDFMQTVGYWVRNLEPGQKVVISRSK
jgi:hypothetical protein